jgi:hypothetical protein
MSSVDAEEIYKPRESKEETDITEFYMFILDLVCQMSR